MGLTGLLARCAELFGLLRGAYGAFKALRARPYDAARGEEALRLWAVLGCFLFLYRAYLEWALSFWLPFYDELRLGALVWLLLPGSSAPRYFFERFLHPALTLAARRRWQRRDEAAATRGGAKAE